MRWLNTLLALSTLILVTGCTQSAISSHQTDGTITQDGKQKELTAFEDIPANSDTKLDPDASIIISEGDDWMGRLVLNNDMTPFATFDYYRQHMPELGWNLVASVKSQNAVLTYMKGTRVATLQISGSKFGDSRITITVSPATGVMPKKVK